jgi:hypothetical protein
MTTNEIIRIFDIGAHCLIFFALAHIAVHVEYKAFWTRVFTVFSSFISLFLSLTAWSYGRTPSFLIAHTVWEYIIGANLILLFHKYEAKIRK